MFQINAKCVSGNKFSELKKKSKSRNTHLELNETEEDLKGRRCNLTLKKGMVDFILEQQLS